MDIDDRVERARFSPRFWTILIVLGLAVRIALIATSIGTNDVIFKIYWQNLIEKYGLLGAFAHHFETSYRTLGTFPPLALLLMKCASVTARVAAIEYTDALRALQVVADVVSTFALVRIAHNLQRNAHAVAMFFFLCPAVFFVSAFHCNIDSTMVAFILIGVALLTGPSKHELWAGMALGAAAGIKIVPLFLLPFMAVAARRKMPLFLGGCALSLTAIFLPAVMRSGPRVITNLISYAGYAGKWGVPALALVAEEAVARRGTTVLYTVATLYAGYGKYLILLVLGALGMWFAATVWKADRDADLSPLVAAIVPLIFLIVLFLAPGFGVQYLVWPIALLPFLFPWRQAAVVAGAFSLYLFVTYTIWSQGFPWWYADSIAPTHLKPWVTYLGFPVWLLIGYTCWRGWRNVAR